MITAVITSNNRLSLLNRTVSSFIRFADMPVEEIIIIDDSGVDIGDHISHLHSKYGVPMRYVSNPQRLGQALSIDRAYSLVTTPYIFHMEDDWEFYRTGFMKKSYDALEKYPDIICVHIRHPQDNNGWPYIDIDEKDFYLVQPHYQGHWDGFTWNPGLRRFSDYAKIGSYSKYLREGDFAALTECRIGQAYYDLGYKAVILKDGYCRHLG